MPGTVVFAGRVGVFAVRVPICPVVRLIGSPNGSYTATALDLVPDPSAVTVTSPCKSGYDYTCGDDTDDRPSSTTPKPSPQVGGRILLTGDLSRR